MELSASRQLYLSPHRNQLAPPALYDPKPYAKIDLSLHAYRCLSLLVPRTTKVEALSMYLLTYASVFAADPGMGGSTPDISGRS